MRSNLTNFKYLILFSLPFRPEHKGIVDFIRLAHGLRFDEKMTDFLME
jgi:hypothetical protein